MPEHVFRLFCTNPYLFRSIHVKSRVPVPPLDDRKAIKKLALAELLGNPEGFHETFEVLEYADKRTKAAKEEFSEVLESGGIPLLRPDRDAIEEAATEIVKSDAWAHIADLKGARLPTIEEELEGNRFTGRPFFLNSDHCILLKTVESLGQLKDTLRTSPWVFQTYYNVVLAGGTVRPALLVIEDVAPTYNTVIFNFDYRDMDMQEHIGRCMQQLRRAQEADWRLPTFLSFEVVRDRHLVDFCDNLLWSDA
jgi:hypothetical protein